jgi:hypothetical protein
MSKETFDKLLYELEQSNLDIEIIRSFQLDTATVELILTHYKERLVAEMKTNHPEIYRAFQDNKQAVKLSNGTAIFEKSLSKNQLSKVDTLSVNHQTNRIIYNLALLIKTPSSYETLFDLYKRTKTPSFGGVPNQNTLKQLESKLTSQLQLLHRYYQEIQDGMIEIDQLRNPRPVEPNPLKPNHDSSQKPMSEIAQRLFENYLEKIGDTMKNKYPNLYTAYQTNYCHFSTTKGAGNIFHQLLFNERLNKNTLPAEAEERLNINIEKVMTGISSLIKISEQYSRFHDTHERVKHVHGLPKEDALIDLKNKLSETVNQSENITTDIMEGLKQIDALDKQYQEQPSLLSSEQINDLISSKSMSVNLTPQNSLENQQNQTSKKRFHNRAASNASFKRSLSDIKDPAPKETVKPSFKP